MMTGHVLYPALDKQNVASFSKPILQDLLRTQWKYEGLIVTDSLDMKGATTFCTIAGCAVRSLEAGADMVLLGRYIKPSTLFGKIFNEVQEKNLEETVKKAAAHILKTKQELGLLDGSRSIPDPIGRAYRITLAELSQEAVTLVRHRGNQIPFSTEKQRPTVCAVFFAPPRFADQLAYFSKPFLAQNFHVRTYNAPLSPHEKDAQRVFKCAEGADLVVVGSLQWADKINLGQKRTIDKLFQMHPGLILLSTMSPYDIVHYPQVDTVLATYGLNASALQTAAEIILGRRQALGVLPVDLPGRKEQ